MKRSRRFLIALVAIIVSAPFIKAANLNVSEIEFPFGAFEISLLVCAILGHIVYQARRRNHVLD